MSAASLVRDITPREYAGFQRLVAEASGITLSDAKRQLLVGRVVRLVRERGLASYGAYLETVQADRTGTELVRLLDLVSTNETSFFRERGHYAYLTETLYPAWRVAAREGERSQLIRVWSAACSTGQEPYSIAMTLLEHFPATEGWSVEVLASDLSTRALRVAERGEYEVGRASEIPTPYLRRFMLRGVGEHEGSMRVTPRLRAPIRFTRINLNETLEDAVGSFDLVFCSNALIYFSRPGRAKVVERLARKLAPGGCLFVGHAESLHEHRAILRAVGPTVYAPVTDPTT